MGMFDNLFGPQGMSLNNAISGVGTAVGTFAPGVGSVIGGAGKLLGSLFGDNTVSQSDQTNETMKNYLGLLKEAGVDLKNPLYKTSEETREDWSVNNARNNATRANNFQTLVSSQGSALNNALSQMGLSSGVGSSAMKVGIGALAPLMANYDAQDAALSNRYADPLRTTYGNYLDKLGDIASSGAGVSSSNQTQQYRSQELEGANNIFSNWGKYNMGNDAINDTQKKVSYQQLKDNGFIDKLMLNSALMAR